MATSEGVEFCRPYPNILAKAAKEFPQLPELFASYMPPELIAHSVCAALDGVVVDTRELPLPANLLD
jgi:branched-subunit amino acid transport protein AzlD